MYTSSFLSPTSAELEAPNEKYTKDPSLRNIYKHTRWGAGEEARLHELASIRSCLFLTRGNNYGFGITNSTMGEKRKKAGRKCASGRVLVHVGASEARARQEQ